MLDFYHSNIALDANTGAELVLNFAQGARFALSRQRIHSRPRSFYARLLEILSKENDPVEGYWLEASWYDVFHPEAIQSKKPACALPDVGEVLQFQDLVKKTSRRLENEGVTLGPPVLSSGNYGYGYGGKKEDEKGSVPAVKMSLLIENLDYNKLVADENKKTLFIKGVKEGVASKANGIEEEHVGVKIKKGSVVVDVTVIPPENVATADVISSLTVNPDDSSSLDKVVVEKIKAIPGIDTIATGNITASVLSQPSETTVTPEGGSQISSAMSEHGVSHIFIALSAFILWLLR